MKIIKHIFISLSILFYCQLSFCQSDSLFTSIDVAKVNPSKVKYLVLNDLDEFPNLKRFKNLQSLTISNSSFESIKKIYAVHLKELVITNSLLIFLPEDIGLLKQLEKLILISNNLHELPNSIGYLSNLRELNLNGNPISGLPNSIYKLNKLEILHLSPDYSRGQLIPLNEQELIKKRFPNCSVYFNE